MKLRIEAIKPKHPIYDQPIMKRAIQNAGQESAMAVQVDFNVTTFTWDHKPEFKIAHKGLDYRWTISTKDEVYGYVSEGTRPHTIVPKVAKVLRFYRTGFKPKSRANWIGANKGKKATKDLTFTRHVNHPGIGARNYPKVIKKKWDDEWPRQLDRAVRAALRYHS